MVGRDDLVMYLLDAIMIGKILDFLHLRGAKGILVFLREFIKILNVFHGGKLGV